MSSRNGANRAAAADDPQSEIEELLRAAEDDLLLKLRAGGSPSPSSLDADLARRFEALKSPPPAPQSAAPPRHPAETEAADEEWGRILGDDLAARFAALKGSSSGSAGGVDLGPELKNSRKELDEYEDEDEDDDGVSKKEVDKLLQWAMDEARLDPSKRDDDAQGSGSSCDDEDEEEEEDLGVEKKVEDKNNTQGKPKKWFLF